MNRHIFLALLIAIIAIILLTMIVYWQGLYGPFLLDDSTSIVGVYIENPGWSGIVHTVTHNTSGLLGRSVTVLSFLLTEAQFGLDPWGYKFHNLLLHVANGLLLFRLLYLLLPLLEPRTRPTNVLLIAGVVTSFWLLHPLLVSTVLYAVQRMVELAVFFTLLALLCYFQARIRISADLRFILFGWVLFPLCLVLAMLSKEIGVLVPVYVLLFEFLVFKTSWNSLIGKSHIKLWLLFFIAIPASIGSLYLVTHFSALADYSTRTFNLYERLLTQLHVVASYVRSILFPRIKEMSLYQDDFPITHDMDIYTLLLLGALLGMLASIWLLRKKAPVIAFGLAWFLGSHLLESTFFPLEMVFEHRNYLATMGLLLPPVFYTFQIQKKELLHLRWLLAAFFIVFVGQTFSRVHEWRNLGTLLTVAVTDHPNSARAHTEYSNYLFNQGRRPEAIEQLEKTMRLNTRDAGSVIHQLVFQCLNGERRDDFLEEAKTRLASWPASVYTLNAIARLMGFINTKACTQLSLNDVEALVQAGLSQPGNLAHGRNHGYLLRFLGMVNFHKGNYREGVEQMLEAHDRSGNIVILNQLLQFQVQLRQFEDADQTLNLVKQLNEQRHGIEAYTVEQLTEVLSVARREVISSHSEAPDL